MAFFRRFFLVFPPTYRCAIDSRFFIEFAQNGTSRYQSRTPYRRPGTSMKRTPTWPNNKLWEAIALARKLNFHAGEATAWNGMGVVEEIKGNLTKAQEYYLWPSIFAKKRANPVPLPPHTTTWVPLRN